MSVSSHAGAIPTLDSISPRWLTEQLRAAGHTRAEVRAFEAAPIGTGQLGKCVRFTLDLADAGGAVPRSVIGKFPSDDPLSRATGVQLGNFLKEVMFYRELQQRMSIRTPRCYFADIDGAGPDFALLLEDMRPATQGNQLAGCSIAVARSAVRELVGLHAPSWCDDTLRGIDWLGEPDAASTEVIRGLYGTHLPAFIDRFGKRLEPDSRRIIERVAASSGPPFLPLSTPFSLVHIDYRLDNLLIDDRVDPPRVTAVDWQSVTLGSPLDDVAYFLGAGLEPEARRGCEEAILREYHRHLMEAGVGDYDWSRCWNDYRRGAFAGFLVTVVASMIVQQTERGDEMFTAMARRHSRHALDLGAEEFLG
jgi:hypothetical protein